MHEHPGRAAVLEAGYQPYAAGQDPLRRRAEEAPAIGAHRSVTESMTCEAEHVLRIT
jgi:hypothetical protein